MTADLRTRVAALESRWLYTADAFEQLESDWLAVGKAEFSVASQWSADLCRSHAAELRDLLEATAS